MSVSEFLARLGVILVADVLLSSDNAVVIALVCRDLLPERRTLGMVLGTGGAVLMRLVMAAFATLLITLPGLRIVGGLLLLYVAYGMVREADEEEEERGGATALWRAVWLVALADASMSLDNVVALAALARGSWALMAAGVVLSIPLVVAGARIIAAIVDRLPLLVWAGAAVLGWVAGGVIVGDPWLAGVLGAQHAAYVLPGESAGAAGVLMTALCARAFRAERRGEEKWSEDCCRHCGHPDAKRYSNDGRCVLCRERL